MQQLQLDSLDGKFVEIFHGFQNRPGILAGKPQNGVDNTVQIPPVKLRCGLFKTGKRISSADVGRGFFVYGLQSQFHPDRFAAVQLFQQFQNVGSQTVRPGADGQGGHRRMGEGFGENFPQIIHGSVRIGVRLEIGNKLIDRTLLPDRRNLLFDLSGDGDAAAGGKISRSAGTAENTSPTPQCSVPVGAAHASIQRDFINLFSKALPEHIIQRVIRLAQPIHATPPFRNFS